MKIRATRTSLYKMFDLIIKVPYCKLQYVLDERDADYYNAGKYGWNYDVYAFKFGLYRVAICTGYRPIGEEWIESWNYDVIEKFARQNKENGKQLFRAVLYDAVVDWATFTQGVKKSVEMLNN